MCSLIIKMQTFLDKLSWLGFDIGSEDYRPKKIKNRRSIGTRNTLNTKATQVFSGYSKTFAKIFSLSCSSTQTNSARL